MREKQHSKPSVELRLDSNLSTYIEGLSTTDVRAQTHEQLSLLRANTQAIEPLQPKTLSLTAAMKIAGAKQKIVDRKMAKVMGKSDTGSHINREVAPFIADISAPIPDIASLKQEDPKLKSDLKRPEKNVINSEQETLRNIGRFEDRISTALVEIEGVSEEICTWIRERITFQGPDSKIENIARLQKLLGFGRVRKYEVDGVFGWRTMQRLEALPKRLKRNNITRVAELETENALT